MPVTKIASTPAVPHLPGSLALIQTAWQHTLKRWRLLFIFLTMFIAGSLFSISLMPLFSQISRLWTLAPVFMGGITIPTLFLILFFRVLSEHSFANSVKFLIKNLHKALAMMFVSALPMGLYSAIFIPY